MKRGIKLLLLSDLWITLSLGMIGPIYAIFVEQIGGDLLDAGWAYFAFMMTTGIVLFIMGKWEDKVKHKERLLLVGYSLMALGCLSYYFVNSQISLVITQIILGLAEAIQLPAYDALYSKYLTKDHAASEWATWESQSYIATAIAAVIGSWIATVYGFRLLFAVMFAISIASIVFSIMVMREISRNQRKKRI